MQEWQRIKDDKIRADQEAEVCKMRNFYLSCLFYLIFYSPCAPCRWPNELLRRKLVSSHSICVYSLKHRLIIIIACIHRGTKGIEAQAIRAKSEEQTGRILLQGQNRDGEDPGIEEPGHRPQLSVLMCACMCLLKRCCVSCIDCNLR